tara:strand:+ start:342 stop:500 length:159 start_codon:yes stop_codon:yes gene_type:complete
MKQRSIVPHHILCRGAEFLVSFYDFGNGIKEILLANGFSPLADGKHTRFRAY